jgi:hypothetical protein
MPLGYEIILPGNSNNERSAYIAGPIKGAAEKAAIGTPLSSVFHKSASVPPTNVMGAENAIPSIKRQTIRVPMFLDTAQGIMKITASRRVDPYMRRRPRTSDRGAKAIGPRLG